MPNQYTKAAEAKSKRGSKTIKTIKATAKTKNKKAPVKGKARAAGAR